MSRQRGWAWYEAREEKRRAAAIEREREDRERSERYRKEQEERERQRRDHEASEEGQAKRKQEHEKRQREREARERQEEARKRRPGYPGYSGVVTHINTKGHDQDFVRPLTQHQFDALYYPNSLTVQTDPYPGDPPGREYAEFEEDVFIDLRAEHPNLVGSYVSVRESGVVRPDKRRQFLFTLDTAPDQAWRLKPEPEPINYENWREVLFGPPKTDTRPVWERRVVKLMWKAISTAHIGQPHEAIALLQKIHELMEEHEVSVEKVVLALIEGDTSGDPPSR